MSRQAVDRQPSSFALSQAATFLREKFFAVILLSTLLLIPCFWHSHIQAGDLGSHVYNAWLAQLIQHGQAPGLHVVWQWNNILFDVLLLKAASAFGFNAAEKIVVSCGVLVFFWGSFSLLAAISGKPRWRISPLLMVLAYGYVFHMGFMNYYFSVGFAFMALAAAWYGGKGNWITAVGFSGASLLAHPIGFVLFVGVATYISLWRAEKTWVRALMPVVVAMVAVVLRFYFATHPALEADWRDTGLAQLLGQDQLSLYGHRYVVLSWVLLFWGLLCVLGALFDAIFRVRQATGMFGLAGQLYAVAIVVTFCLPENFRVGLYAGWIGLLVSRLTLVTAVFALLLLATIPLPRWSIYGFGSIAAIFFSFLYQDTGKLDHLETTARAAIAELPIGARIVAVANPPQDWRIQFIYHSVDRACIGRCFSFANYEAPSLQFRVRAAAGNWFVTTSVDQSDDMSSGDYVVRPNDLPLTAIYQCDEKDFAQMCALPLRAGQRTEDPEAEPGSVPSDGDEDEN
jgi:hypothetical protein